MVQLENVRTFHTLAENCESWWQCHNCCGRESNKQRKKILVRSEGWHHRVEFVGHAPRVKLKEDRPRSLTRTPASDERPAERGAVPAGRGFVPPALGRLGHHPAGTMTGMRGARWTGIGFGAGNAREDAQGLRPRLGGRTGSNAPDRPRKHGLTPRLGDQPSSWREPQWNADRRARPAGCALRRQVQQVTTRLSAFCFLVLFFFSVRPFVRAP